MYDSSLERFIIHVSYAVSCDSVDFIKLSVRVKRTVDATFLVADPFGN